MLSKMYPIFFLSFIFLSHCGLQIGEKAPLVPKYKIDSDLNYCSSLDYKKELKNYFFHNLDEEKSFETRGKRFKKSLDCLAAAIREGSNKINGDSLEIDVYKFFSKKYIKTEGQSEGFFIKRLADKENFENVLSIKNNLLFLIRSHQQNQVVTENQFCRTVQATESKPNFSKETLNTFIQMLHLLASFSIDLENSSHKIYEGFFNKEEYNETSLAKSQLQDSIRMQEDFIPFLVDYFNSGTFKKYVPFTKEATKNLLVKSQLQDSIRMQEDFIPFLVDYFNSGTFKKYLPFIKEVTRDEESFLQMAVTILQFPTNSFDQITDQDVKYLLSNIFFTKIIFDLYDINENQLLDQEELDILTCLLKPIVRFVFSQKLKGQSLFVREAYTEEKIISYILKEKQLPIGGSAFIVYFKFWVDSANPISMSYAEFSLVIGKLVEELVFSKKP